MGTEHTSKSAIRLRWVPETSRAGILIGGPAGAGLPPDNLDKKRGDATSVYDILIWTSFHEKTTYMDEFFMKRQLIWTGLS